MAVSTIIVLLLIGLAAGMLSGLVGILLSDHEIIHASGKVRVDTIDREGIINKETLKRSHHLAVIKRFW